VGEGGRYVAYQRIGARYRRDDLVAPVAVADCDRQDMRKLAALGVAAQENAFAKLLGSRGAPKRDCVLDGVRDVKKVFSTLDFGPSTGKLAPQ